MGWAFCETDDGREVGYGVTAQCDFPGCAVTIDRGLAYVCGTMHGGENGCGKYFCAEHRATEQHGCPCLVDCAAGEHCQVGGSYCLVCGEDLFDSSKGP